MIFVPYSLSNHWWCVAPLSWPCPITDGLWHLSHGPVQSLMVCGTSLMALSNHWWCVAPLSWPCPITDGLWHLSHGPVQSLMVCGTSLMALSNHWWCVAPLSWPCPITDGVWHLSSCRLMGSMALSNHYRSEDLLDIETAAGGFQHRKGMWQCLPLTFCFHTGLSQYIALESLEGRACSEIFYHCPVREPRPAPNCPVLPPTALFFSPLPSTSHPPPALPILPLPCPTSPCPALPPPALPCPTSPHLLSPKCTSLSFKTRNWAS